MNPSQCCVYCCSIRASSVHARWLLVAVIGPTCRCQQTSVSNTAAVQQAPLLAKDYDEGTRENVVTGQAATASDLLVLCTIQHSKIGLHSVTVWACAVIQQLFTHIEYTAYQVT
jgi:hypothetical protein